jgi:xanthine dehydrogenase YagR molybdenum-binding subunit
VGGPYGARGIGEIASIGVVASVANAIYNATGARVRQSPITAEKIFEAINRRRRNRK